ncbi:FAD-dependent oxidoreductase [Natroniella sulfidigena]|uniref:FAD-dependent oxidoreductase n=1 Tax=Natroniella sulfidigena TaxID=723921 RepID=UPI00200A8006|nr:FAD-dependent oxidoreductase [Natroniella sulfidigena]MCK8818071.1 FAD-dependent oxidoreductase [Natroniella sulfidigena]
MPKNSQPKIEIYTLNWCPYCNKAKSFLKSKGFSFQEYDVEQPEVKEELLKRTDGVKAVPQIFIDDQLVGGYDSMIEKKQQGELDRLLGVEAEDNFDQQWDLIIIGAGPAGLNAALYGARKGLKILIIAEVMGGQMVNTSEIGNYLGFQKTNGLELTESFWDHVKNYEVEVELGERVVEVKKKPEAGLIVKTNTEIEAQAKAVLVATGTTNRELDVPGEKKLMGRGVHYCATCDGHLYAGQPVAVVGGGNAGLEAALDLAKIDCKVELIEAQSELTGDQILRDKVYEQELITVHTETGVKEIEVDEKDDSLSSIILTDIDEETERRLDVDGVFVEIGLLPNSDFIADKVEVNEIEEIIIDENNETSLEGVWAAGDVTNIAYKQIIISAAEGAKAALGVSKYLS